MNNKLIFFIPMLAISTALFAQSGNVGIGTNAPAEKLQVSGTQPVLP
jgi:hypothetical protein